MADGITVNTKGIKDLSKKLKKLGPDFERIVSLEVKAAAFEGETDAKIRAPKNLGNLRNSIKAEPVDLLTWRLTASELYAPFVEFGTGGKVDIPPGFEDLAAQFKGGAGGSFKEGLEAIRKWCRNKGIDERAAYPIFISILDKGMEAQPFLIPAGKFAAKRLEEAIQSAIKNYKI